ncbi:Uma2 family endonuclease [Aquisphaera giovannonii]|uniref:Uma2 family endonuclease n=1 Tax=Aquisphaera giovannonii TaxID=406548 RepID=UPI00143DDD0E|nr:Uma2 family endonuclease [Aquisphaera giovannonii]
MSTIAEPRLMTTEELLALPEDGVDRELIRGVLRARPMTRRNRWHSTVESRLVLFLGTWLNGRPEPRGEIVSGEAGFVLRRDPDSNVGIDVAYVSPEVAAAEPSSPYFEGPPVLAVEILSPSDTQEDIDEKIQLYLETGVAVVWIINAKFRTVTAYRPDAEPIMFSGDQELTAEPHLPGFRVRLGEVFGR